jgi:1-acyl-sn-glycerol-3-phosphate acyltransferase
VVIFYFIYTWIITVVIFIVSMLFVLISLWMFILPGMKRYKVADYLFVIPWTFIVNNFVLFMRVRIIGKEYRDRNRTTLYICNHQSWADIPILIRYSHATGISKKEVRRIPMIGILAMLGGDSFLTGKS